MTSKKTTQGLQIDPEAFYSVQLTRAVRLGRIWLRPGTHNLTLKGKVILNEEVAPYVGQILPVSG